MDRLSSAAEVARRLGISAGRVYELVREELLPGAARLGRQLRISEHAVAEFIAGGGKAWPGGWRKTSRSSGGR